MRRSIRETAAGTPGVSGINDSLTMHFGPQEILVAMSLEFDDAMDVGAVERTVTAIEAEVKRRHPEVRRVFIEAQRRADHRAASTVPQASEAGAEPG